MPQFVISTSLTSSSPKKIHLNLNKAIFLKSFFNQCTRYQNRSAEQNGVSHFTELINVFLGNYAKFFLCKLLNVSQGFQLYYWIDLSMGNDNLWSEHWYWRCTNFAIVTYQRHSFGILSYASSRKFSDKSLFGSSLEPLEYHSCNRAQSWMNQDLPYSVKRRNNLKVPWSSLSLLWKGRIKYQKIHELSFSGLMVLFSKENHLINNFWSKTLMKRRFCIPWERSWAKQHKKSHSFSFWTLRFVSVRYLLQDPFISKFFNKIVIFQRPYSIATISDRSISVLFSCSTETVTFTILYSENQVCVMARSRNLEVRTTKSTLFTHHRFCRTTFLGDVKTLISVEVCWEIGKLGTMVTNRTTLLLTGNKKFCRLLPTFFTCKSFVAIEERHFSNKYST